MTIFFSGILMCDTSLPCNIFIIQENVLFITVCKMQKMLCIVTGTLQELLQANSLTNYF